LYFARAAREASGKITYGEPGKGRDEVPLLESRSNSPHLDEKELREERRRPNLKGRKRFLEMAKIPHT